MSMKEAGVSAVQQILDQLRTELVDMAYELEMQRRIDAADVAIAAAARVKELGRAFGESVEREEPALIERSAGFRQAR